jgi:hypothetical protein
MNVNISIFLKRLILNIAWLLALVAVSYLYDQTLSRIEILRDFFRDIPWYAGISMLYIPFIAIQSIFQWFTLKHFYPKERLGNIIWIMLMPFLFVICYAYLQAYLFAQAISHLR